MLTRHELPPMSFRRFSTQVTMVLDDQQSTSTSEQPRS